VLRGLGIEDEDRPILRAAVRSWTASLDELVSESLEYCDVPRAQLVDVAVATLVAALRAAAAADPGVEFDSAVMKLPAGP
jgi:hypothetical protein